MNTYNISFLSQDNSQLKLTVTDGSKSRFTKMLTLTINFPEKYFDSTTTDRPKKYKINSLPIVIEKVLKTKEEVT